MSAGGTPAVLFLFTGSPRFARDDKGDEVDNYALSNHPAPLGHPSNGGELILRRDEGQVPLCGGVPAMPAGWSLYPPLCKACPPPEAVGITCTLHSNKKRGGAPFFLNTVCVYPTTVSQQSRGHAFVAAQGVYDTACLCRVQIHNAYFVHVAFLDDDGVAIFHHTGRQ